MSECPRDAMGRSACAEFIRSELRRIGEEIGQHCEIEVHATPPPIMTIWTQNAYRCAHGKLYYINPTDAQIAEWKRGRVR